MVKRKRRSVSRLRMRIGTGKSGRRLRALVEVQAGRRRQHPEPNAETRAALREPPESLVSYGSVDEMLADLWHDA